MTHTDDLRERVMDEIDNGIRSDPVIDYDDYSHIADVVIALVRADERKRIREALLSEADQRAIESEVRIPAFPEYKVLRHSEPLLPHMTELLAAAGLTEEEER